MPSSAGKKKRPLSTLRVLELGCLYTCLISFLLDAADICALSLHDALPICQQPHGRRLVGSDLLPLARDEIEPVDVKLEVHRLVRRYDGVVVVLGRPKGRSEEHMSELQSHVNLVCRLLLEKKKGR